MTKLLTFTKNEESDARVGPLVGLDGQELARSSNELLPSAAKRPDAHSQQLRLSVIAARFAKELHFAHTAYYYPDDLLYRPDPEQEHEWTERIWRAFSTKDRIALIEEAAGILLERAPELCPKCSQAYVPKGATYCGPTCRIDAENNR